MTRPITLVYQELAQQTTQAIEPDLNTLILGAAYQILDYEDDKEDIRVSDYGALQADNPVVPPVASIPAITIVAPPNLTAGGWVDPLSIRVYFDNARVIMASGADGSVTTADNLLTSAGATFVTDEVAVGDTLIIANPVGPATPNLKLTVLQVVSETTLRVTTNFLATTASLAYRVERTVSDEQIDASFLEVPTFRSSNEVIVLGGVTLPVGDADRVVTYGEVYMAYRAYRTDLQAKGAIQPGTAVNDILTQVGKIDSRNPLAAHLWVASQNAGQAPIYYFGVDSDDLLGFTKARDALSSDKDSYALVLCNPSLAINAMFRTDNVTLADPDQALASGVPQKFRVAHGSVPLPTEEILVEETATGTTEVLTGAIPAGVRTITVVTEDFPAAGVRPGDRLIITASSSTPSIDGSYNIAHINGDHTLEVDSAFPATIVAPAGINIQVIRPSTGASIIPLADYRASLNFVGMTVYASVAGVAAGARTIAFVQDATTVDGIQSIVEVADTSTVVNGDFAGGNITSQQVTDALNTGAGVTVAFTGSVNVTAVATTPAATEVAAGAAAISTGTPGVNDLTSTAVLDAVYLRLFDAAASFISDGVIPGDVIEIPQIPNGSFTTLGTKQYTVDQVLSEQRLQITNAVAGAYVNNSSTAEVELPHFDTRLGTDTVVTQGSIRYRVVRELTTDQQVDHMVAIAQSLRSQRALLQFPDSVLVSGLVDGSKPRNVDGTPAAADPQPGTYLSAVVGGMTAGLPNHQGFSRLGVAGISRVYNSQGYFTERQLTELSEGGLYVFVQDTPESLPYTIHQLTTDPSALQTGEYSMVKNLDYLSKFYVGILDPFIGIWNINEETLGFMRQAVNSGTARLKLRRVARIGAPLIDAAIASLSVSTASPDRVELYMNLDRPVPLNVIGLHLVG